MNYAFAKLLLAGLKVILHLFQKLMMFNPHKRISAKEALNHAYFRDDLDTSRTSSSPSMSSPSMSESDSTDGRSDTPVSK